MRREAPAPGDVIEADVCVAGAGPSGLAVALGLAAAGVKVALLERGGQGWPGEVEGSYPPLAETRAGGLGGTAALWNAELAPGSYGARYGPLSPLDFRERDWVPWSGWPFPGAELDRWYARAHELCDAGPCVYDPTLAGITTDGAEALTPRIFRFGTAGVFMERHRGAVGASPNIRVVEPATALELVIRGGAVTELRAAAAPGHDFSVRARKYVLALGGIENARFLLLGSRGNEHDLVGRFFMDHPTARCRLEPVGPPAAALDRFDVREADGRMVVAAAALRPEVIAEQRLLNSSFFIVPAPGREARAVESAGTIVDAARRGRLPSHVARELGAVVAGLDGVGVEAHRRLVRRVPLLRPTARLSPRLRLLDTLGVGSTAGWSRLRGRPVAFDVHHVIEQAPERERRVTLGRGRDGFGRRLALLGFFVSERELASLDRTQELFGQELERAGLGRFRTTRSLATAGAAAAVHPSAHHHLGTTRMADDRARGVVDRDGRVHGLENVYMAGGSVFPTGGCVNPTLTIVALAARLADHLHREALR